VGFDTTENGFEIGEIRQKSGFHARFVTWNTFISLLFITIFSWHGIRNYYYSFTKYWAV